MRWTSHQQSLRQPKSDHFFSENLMVTSYGSFALWGCYSLALLITHFISFEVQRRLSKFYSTHNKSQSWHLTNDHSCMVEIIGIRNYAFHDPMPGHQLNINVLWRNAVSAMYIIIWPSVSWYFLGLDSGAFHTAIKGGSLWDLKFCKCGLLSSRCISQFANMEIICKQCKLRIEDICHSFGQDLRFKHVLIVDSICH